MADDKNSGKAGAKTAEPRVGTANSPQTAAPQWRLVTQYIKDLSFENPKAPASIVTGTGMPQFDVNINVAVNRQSEDVYAVELTLVSKASRDKDILFNIELVYGGAFHVQNIPDEQLPPLLMIECPRLLFPFARQILANVTQQGGFPPLMMEPVDFVALYRSNLEAMEQAQKDKGGAVSN